MNRCINSCQRSGFTLIELLVVIGVVSLLMALLLPAVQQARESSQRARCANNLRQLGLAIHSYQSSQQWFPPISTSSPTGQGFDLQEYSVFTRILPSLEQSPLYDAINFSLGFQDPYFYDGKLGAVANSTVMGSALGVLLCPSDGFDPMAPTKPTSYRASIGRTVWWVGGGSGSGNASPGGPFGVDASATTDGLSNTAAFGEKLIGRVSSPSFDARLDMAKGFMVPSDIAMSVDQCATKTGTPLGFFTTAGLSWFVGTITHAEYNHGFTPNGPIADCVLSGVNPPMGLITTRSNHPGGVNLGMADGSVRFITNGVAGPTWAALGTRAGGEVFEMP